MIILRFSALKHDVIVDSACCSLLSGLMPESYSCPHSALMAKTFTACLYKMPFWDKSYSFFIDCCKSWNCDIIVFFQRLTSRSLRAVISCYGTFSWICFDRMAISGLVKIWNGWTHSCYKLIFVLLSRKIITRKTRHRNVPGTRNRG